MICVRHWNETTFLTTQKNIRKAKKGEVLPTIYMEGKPTNKFDPDFFIVSIAHGVPTGNKVNQSILKTYDFPAVARVPKGIITDSQVKDYFKKYASDRPEFKCANFYFFVYLAKVFDIDTAVNFAKQIIAGKIDWEILRSLLSSIISI